MRDAVPILSRSQMIAIDREKIRRCGFHEFVKRAWHVVEPAQPFVDGWHVREMCVLAESLIPRPTREHPLAVMRIYPSPALTELVVNVPPGTTKSKIWSVLLVAFVWTYRPEYSFIFASYEDSIATGLGKNCLDLCSSQWYRDRFGEILASGERAASEFRTRAGGMRFATSIGGALTGKHANFLGVDDPVKPPLADGNLGGPSEAAEIQRANVWLESTAFSRTKDAATFVKVIIMQRIAENDPAGTCILKGFRRYTRQMVRDKSLDVDPLNKKPINDVIEDPREHGALLAPERFPAEVVAKIMAGKGGADGPIWVSQYQQAPAPKGGLLFKREQFRRFALADMPLARTFSIMSIDANFKSTATSADVGITIWGGSQAKIYLYDALSRNVGFVDALTLIDALLKRWRVNAIMIEDKANGTALIDVLRKRRSDVLAPDPKTSKEARAQAANVYYQAGAIYHCSDMGADALDEFENTLAVFPRGRKRDTVDSATQAILYLVANDRSSFELAMRRWGENPLAALSQLGGFGDHFVLR